ncbi:MAG: lipoprotein-releasing system permease protein [Pseudohongiellaceae bacterium]
MLEISLAPGFSAAIATEILRGLLGQFMASPLSFWVALRFTLARKHSLILSFVSLISMLGISLGVLILIVALSVINGSIATLRGEALKSVPHVTAGGEAIAQSWQAIRAVVSRHPQVEAAAPFIVGDATLSYQGKTAFAQLRGVDALLEADVVDNSSEAYGRLLDTLQQTDNGIILGTQLASQLGLFTAGDLRATSLQSLLTRSLRDAQGFRVIGFADFGIYGRNNLALVNLEQAQELFATDAGVQIQLRLKVNDLFAAKQIAATAFAEIPSSQPIQFESWDEAQASLFAALAMEKYLTGFMLLMIVMIGAVNIVSTLVMVVSDKSADIAILRTMGASKGLITRIFICQGMIAGVIGTALGVALGVTLALTITDLSLALERLINSIFPDANVYLISHLQTSLQWSELLVIAAAALLISFLATIYPAYRAGRVQPAEVLRYE